MFYMIIALLDSKVRAMLDKAADGPSWHTVPVEQARTMFLAGAIAGAGDIPAPVSSEDILIPSSDVAIPARLYKPEAAPQPCPTLLFFHGGGFVLGSLDSHDAMCRYICAKSGVQVLAVDYRLAPEHKFPAALDDALAASRWLISNCQTIGADPKCLAIGGDSAGANLATTVCRLLRYQDLFPFRHQSLIYPMIDLRMAMPSYQMFGEGYRLTRDIARWFIDSYMQKSDDATDPKLSPLLADDVSLLPPAFILTAGFDPLRDEGQAYAAALNNAGVPCEHVCFEDMIHGFCIMPKLVPRAYDALDAVSRELNAALA